MAEECEGTNIKNGTDVQDIFEIPAVRYVFVAFYAVGIILATLGNGYLIFYIIHHRRRTRKNVTAWLILNLAFCDFIITILTPLRVADILMPRNSDDGEIYCKVGSFFSLFLACIAYMSIVAISCERLLLICYPFQSKSWLTVSNTAKVILASWTLSFFTALPLPILYTFIVTIPLSNKIFQFCLMNVFPQSCQNPGGTAYFMFLFITYYLTPMITITICYSKIFHTLYCGSALLKNTADHRQQRMIQTRKSLAKMMLFIAVSFTLLQGPYFFTFLFLSIGFRIGDNAVFLLMIIEFLPMISAIINPFVYSVRTKTFKKSVSIVSTGVQRESLLRQSMQRSMSKEPRPIPPDDDETNMVLLTTKNSDATNGHTYNENKNYITIGGFKGDEHIGTSV